MNSHGLPAGIYRTLSAPATVAVNPNPFHITKSGTFQTSAQRTARILCSDCEQRFSARGERWVLTNGLRANGSFKLAEVLNNKAVFIEDVRNNWKMLRSEDLPEVDVVALVYFAASMFWRMSVYPWNDDGAYPVKLGNYQEQFRQYLLGQRAFPNNAYLWVMVRQGGVLDKSVHTPISEKRDGLWIHRFPMPGFVFTMCVGSQVPAAVQTACIVHGQEKPIIMGSALEPLLFRLAVKMYEASKQQIARKQSLKAHA